MDADSLNWAEMEVLYCGNRSLLNRCDEEVFEKRYRVLRRDYLDEMPVRPVRRRKPTIFERSKVEYGVALGVWIL